MCGILALLGLHSSLSCLREQLPGEFSNVIPFLNRRGPDHQAWLSPWADKPGLLWMYSAVLHLRGSQRCDQPLTGETENVLCWNGEVFGGDVEVPASESDTKILFLQLSGACTSEDDSAIIDVLGGIEGPFAFIFWEARKRRLWFGRDRLGRRSLVVKRPTEEDRIFGISSCIGSHSSAGWEEVEPGSIHCVRVRDIDADTLSAEEQRFPWPERSPPLQRVLDETQTRKPDESCAQETITKLEDKMPVAISGSSEEQLLRLLDDSVRVRVQGVVRLRPGESDSSDTPLAVMFSGGLDSTLLAALAHRHAPADAAIDLINVSFDPLEAPDRYTGVESLRELRRLCPSRRWRLVAVDVTEPMVDDQRSRVLALTSPCNTQMDFNIGAALWFGSRGVGTIYDSPEEDTGEVLRPVSEQEEPGNSSAGSRRAELDVSAAGVPLRGEETPQEERSDRTLEGEAGAAAGPDEQVHCEDGYKPLRSELTEVVHAVHCRHPELGVKGMLAQVRREQPGWVVGEGRIKPILSRAKKASGQLGAPRRGSGDGEFVAGTATDPRQRQAGRRERPIAEVLGAGREGASRASVLLLGMGADEQLCGYSRYRTKLKVAGEGGVLREMAMDMARIWQRNLGRDDRCLSDHGREARFPFLDERVVSFLASLPLSELADLSLPPGVGDKLLLRRVGTALGLRGAAGEVKRAIQFGTRIAKQSNKATFGSNRKGSGQAPVSLEA